MLGFTVTPALLLAILACGSMATPAPPRETQTGRANGGGNVTADDNLVVTFYSMYSNHNCDNYIETVGLQWDPDDGVQTFGPFPYSGGGEITFKAVKFESGSPAQDFSLCQYGHSCFNAGTVPVGQQDGTCYDTTSGDFDKFLVQP